MSLITLFAVIAALCGGILGGYFLRVIYALGKQGSIELRIKEMDLVARREAENIKSTAEKEAVELLKQVRAESKAKEEVLAKLEERIVKKEEQIAMRNSEIDLEHKKIESKERELAKLNDELTLAVFKKSQELQRVANLSEEAAREELFASIERSMQDDAQSRLRKLQQSGIEHYERTAKELLAAAIQRYGNAVPSDVFTSTVPLPNDETKGKIIGKEGRNIKTFERVTGVDIVVDDTPGAVVLSCHDPVRRQIAYLALKALIEDGRIQPARIEFMVEKAEKEVHQTMRTRGEEAAYECGVFDLDQKLLAILGRLHYRTSYGQNVLQHSVEMAHIAGVLAEELGANVSVAKAGALLHDIGKAVDHEVQGSHVEIGRRILQKFHVDEAVIKAMQAHHEEYPYETIESIIVQVADAISGGRPGARKDSADQYLRRLSDLETIALRQKNVEKAYALQAGRELRVFVHPDQTSDTEAYTLAKKIVSDIEKELKFPGEIKVLVVRETRCIEVAR